MTIDELVPTAALHLLGAFSGQLVTRSCTLRSTTTTATNSLATGTEETLHTVEIAHILASGLLRLALAVVNLLMLGLLLQVAAIISKASLLLCPCSI